MQPKKKEPSKKERVERNPKYVVFRVFVQKERIYKFGGYVYSYMMTSVLLKNNIKKKSPARRESIFFFAFFLCVCVCVTGSSLKFKVDAIDHHMQLYGEASFTVGKHELWGRHENCDLRLHL